MTVRTEGVPPDESVALAAALVRRGTTGASQERSAS
jgi:hypothetical protein